MTITRHALSETRHALSGFIKNAFKRTWDGLDCVPVLALDPSLERQGLNLRVLP